MVTGVPNSAHLKHCWLTIPFDSKPETGAESYCASEPRGWCLRMAAGSHPVANRLQSVGRVRRLRPMEGKEHSMRSRTACRTR